MLRKIIGIFIYMLFVTTAFQVSSNDLSISEEFYELNYRFNNIFYDNLNNNDLDPLIFFYNNSPPNTPPQADGPTSGETYVWYTFSISTTDPDDDSMRYGWDSHGDHIVDFWTELYYPSGTTCYVAILFKSPGTRYVSVIAEDIHGARSNFSEPLTVVIVTGENDPPNTPEKPIGPVNVMIGEVYTYYSSSVDPEYDDIVYGWDWNGDDNVDQWTNYYESGQICYITYSWSEPGTFNIKVKARDDEGLESDFSEPLQVIVITDNNPPDKPSIPSGSSSGKTGVSYSYESKTIDSDGDLIWYQFDWDDDSVFVWEGPYNSNDTISVSHIWDSEGTFQVKVKAKDSQDAESVWSDPLLVSMPKSKEYKIFEQLIVRILEKFPMLERLFN